MNDGIYKSNLSEKNYRAANGRLGRNGACLQDNRQHSVLQRKQAAAMGNAASDMGIVVAQLARTNQPGGNPIGRGGKGNKKRDVKPRKIRQPAANKRTPGNTLTAPATNNPLQNLMNLSEINIKSQVPARIKKLVGRTDLYFNEPHMQSANAYLGGLRDQLQEQKQYPDNVKLSDIALDNDTHGYYDVQQKNLSLGILNPKAEEKYYSQGYGNAHENLAETAVHEYTHVFDLETANQKPYRKLALAGLKKSLPFLSPDAQQDENVERMRRMKQVGGLLDPHIDLTNAQGFLRQNSHVPLLSELMANFAELGSTNDPISHLLMRDSMIQNEGESDEAYQQRITNDYNLLMHNAVLPYTSGIVNDETLPKTIRDFFLQTMMRVPTSGEELYAAVTNRRNEMGRNPHFQAAALEYLVRQGQEELKPQAKQARQESNLKKLQDKIKEKRDQRRKK